MTDQDSVAAVQALLFDYIEKFNSGDFTAAAASYHFPFSWIIGTGIATAFTAEDFIARMHAMRDGLLAQGFERSKLVACTVRMLGADAALAGVEVVRHFGDGRETETTGGTYTVHHDGAQWRLANIIGHPIEAIVGRGGAD